MVSLNALLVACAATAAPLLATATSDTGTGSRTTSSVGVEVADVEASLGYVTDSRRLLQRSRRAKYRNRNRSRDNNGNDDGNDDGGSGSVVSTFVEETAGDEEFFGPLAEESSPPTETAEVSASAGGGSLSRSISPSVENTEWKYDSDTCMMSVIAYFACPFWSQSHVSL